MSDMKDHYDLVEKRTPICIAAAQGKISMKEAREKLIELGMDESAVESNINFWKAFPDEENL